MAIFRTSFQSFSKFIHGNVNQVVVREMFFDQIMPNHWTKIYLSVPRYKRHIINEERKTNAAKSRVGFGCRFQQCDQMLK